MVAAFFFMWSYRMTHEERVSYIRNLFFDTPQGLESISDEKISFFVTRWETELDIEKHPELNFKVIYNASIDCLNWIVMATQSSVSGGSYRSKEGQVEVAITNYDASYGWKKLLEYLTLHPEMVDPSLKAGCVTPIFGGVSKSKSQSVRDNPDSLGTRIHVGWLNNY